MVGDGFGGPRGLVRRDVRGVAVEAEQLRRARRAAATISSSDAAVVVLAAAACRASGRRP